jgi:hypothetical protein
MATNCKTTRTRTTRIPHLLSVTLPDRLGPHEIVKAEMEVVTDVRGVPASAHDVSASLRLITPPFAP